MFKNNFLTRLIDIKYFACSRTKFLGQTAIQVCLKLFLQEQLILNKKVKKISVQEIRYFFRRFLRFEFSIASKPAFSADFHDVKLIF